MRPKTKPVDLVLDEIRAEMGRQRISGTQLGDRAGMSQTMTSARLTGRVSLTVDDLVRIAAALNVPVAQLVAPADAPAVTA